MGHRNTSQEKLGVKLIHLVRNPFQMAISNYHYHGQDNTPEPYVHTKDPCNSLTKKTIGGGGDVEADLESIVLSQPRMSFSSNNVNVSLSNPIMLREEFDLIVQDCKSLYQTIPGYEKASFYKHLQCLPSKV